MACDITSGRAKKCKENIGGLSAIFLFNFVEDPFTINSENLATAVSSNLLEAFKFDLVGSSGSLTESIVGDRQTNTSVNTQTLTFMAHQMDASTSANFNLLVKGYPQAVVKTKKGDYHLVGQSEGIDFSIEATTGSAQSEANGYSLTGVSIERSLSPILDAATVSTFLTLI